MVLRPTLVLKIILAQFLMVVETVLSQVPVGPTVVPGCICSAVFIRMALCCTPGHGVTRGGKGPLNKRPTLMTRCVVMVSMFIGLFDLLGLLDMAGFEVTRVAVGMADTGAGKQEHEGCAQDTYHCCCLQILECSHG